MNERLLKNPILLSAATGVMAFGVGSAVGYILGKRQRQYVHAVPAQDWSAPDVEITSIEKTEDGIEVDVELTEAGKEFVESVIEEVIPERRTIFAATDDEWDYEEELANRKDNDEVYVLHKDEFYADELGFVQNTLIYYAGDDIMVDEEDKPVYNHGTIVGPLLFGHGSGDPNVFHVRNTKMRAEYEILRHEGKYSVEVLGLEIEDNAREDLQHSEPRRFKRD